MTGYYHYIRAITIQFLSVKNQHHKISNTMTTMTTMATMAPVWILLLILQVTHTYNIQKRGRDLEVEGSGEDEDNMMLEIEDMMKEENKGDEYSFESLFAYYSDVRESLKNYQYLLEGFTPSFAAAFPRSLIGDKVDLQLVIDSVKQFGQKVVMGLPSDQFIARIPLYTIAAILSAVLFSGLYALWVISDIAR